jgi:hypothetical protein
MSVADSSLEMSPIRGAESSDFTRNAWLDNSGGDMDSYPLDPEELELKRELAIREREGRWRSKQEEALFQKRMVEEWKIKERERRVAQSKAERRRAIDAEKGGKTMDAVSRVELETKRKYNIQKRETQREMKEKNKALNIKTEAAESQLEVTARLTRASEQRSADLLKDVTTKRQNKEELDLLESKRKESIQVFEQQQRDRQLLVHQAFVAKEEAKRKEAEEAKQKRRREVEAQQKKQHAAFQEARKLEAERKKLDEAREKRLKEKQEAREASARAKIESLRK